MFTIYTRTDHDKKELANVPTIMETMELIREYEMEYGKGCKVWWEKYNGPGQASTIRTRKIRR